MINDSTCILDYETLSEYYVDYHRVVVYHRTSGQLYCPYSGGRVLALVDGTVPTENSVLTDLTDI